jgi:hypothetical protein
MVYFIRILLIFLIIFLVIRSFIKAGSGGSNIRDPGEDDKINNGKRKGVPKSIGEYVDFEEVKKND